MKKIILGCTVGMILIPFLLAIPGQVQAQSETERQLGAFAGTQGANFGEARDPRIVLAGIIRTLLTLVGTLFLAYTVYAGYVWMTAGGDESKTAKAKSTLQTAVIGVLITLSAYAIVTFVTTRLWLATTAPDDPTFQGGVTTGDLEDRRRNQNPDPLNSPGSPFVPDDLNESVIIP